MLSLEDFGLKLHLLSRLLRREIDVLLEPHGLSEASFLPVRYLARFGEGLRQVELADAMGIEGPTLVRVLDQLVKAGLVERIDDAVDRRAKRVHLTTEGEAFHRRFQEPLLERRQVLFAGATAEDLEAALRVFDVLETTLRKSRSS